MAFISSFLFLVLINSGCVVKNSNASFENSPFRVSPADKNVRITGRVDHWDDSVGIYWPGTSVMIRFTGKEISAYLKDERGDNYLNIILDGDSIRHIRLDSVKRKYILASGLDSNEHTIELIKRTEWDKGVTTFYGFELSSASVLPLPPAHKRVIEFFGNSITAGYAIDDTTGGDSPDSTFTNNYYTYGAITARHFNADYYATVRSGIGIMVSWFPLIMPEMYDRLNPLDSLSKWNFKNVTPQVVVINLFQNDSWLVKMPDHPSFKQRFGSKAPDAKHIQKAYKDFVQRIRSVYPSAHIICSLGSMDATKEGSPWPGYVTQVVNEINDKRIHTLFFPFTGKSGHPRRVDNEAMAKVLINFIDEHVEW